MDLNIIVAAAVLLFTAILVSPFAVRISLFFMLAGLLLFLIGLGIDPSQGRLNLSSDMSEKQEGKEETKAPYVPPARGIRIGVPPRTIPLPPRKKDAKT